MSWKLSDFEKIVLFLTFSLRFIKTLANYFVKVIALLCPSQATVVRFCKDLKDILEIFYAIRTCIFAYIGRLYKKTLIYECYFSSEKMALIIAAQQRV